MNSMRQQLQKGFAWLPVIIVVAVIGILGGGTTFYQAQQKRQAEQQAEVEALRQETAELKQVITTEEKRADESSLPTPEPSPSPTPEVKAATTTTSAPKPKANISQTAANTPPPTTQSVLSKKEECEAKVLKARVDGRETVNLVKKKLYAEGIKPLEDQRDKLLNQMKEASGSDVYAIHQLLTSINKTIADRYEAVNKKVDALSKQGEEKMLSDCLNTKE